MARFSHRYTIALPLAALLLALALSLAFAGGALAQDNPPQSTEEYCLSCHANPELSLTLPSGETVSLYISPEELATSVHSPIGIECGACHTNIDTFPHPPIDFEDHRQLQMSYYQACQRCHRDLYEETQDSIHAEIFQQGNLEAPICVDCHGAHDIQPLDQPRTRISTTCGQCHQDIYTEYKDSVHGTALIEEDNPDVPVCTDCHGVHAIHDPRTEIFRIETPELCAGCHADEELMAKYGLPADVYSTYDLSWHGVDVRVFKARWPNLWHNSAVCTDCHGVHDILKTENPASRVSEQNLLATCQQCHEDAGPQFVSAWTGHTEISLEETPFVFYTEVFYNYFSYSVLVVSAIYVLLQILRQTVARVRRSLE